jgi:short-subunit dehydrogenase
MYYMGPVDMKKKYNAKWALVTGAGTGIGKSIAETMALQGLNVVLVSLSDKFLEETTAELKKSFPTQKFIAVPAKFDHKTDYMPAIIKVSQFALLCSLVLFGVLWCSLVLLLYPR